MITNPPRDADPVVEPRLEASQGLSAEPHLDASRLSLRRLSATQRIETSGIYDVPPDQYHGDPCAVPSLSSSIAVMLLEQSPRHAWHAHPRLNPDFLPDDKKADRKMEIGTAAHALLLGRGAEVVEIDADDYKTKAAQEARLAAISAGKAPILSADLYVVENMVAAAREQLAAMGRTAIFEHGLSEAVMIWKDEAGPWCRAMLDHLHIGDGFAVIRDVKTSGTSINPNGRALDFKLVDMAYDLKASFYIRGLIHLHPELAGRVRFEHLWIENDEPYSLVISELDGASIDIGAKKAAVAIGIWQECLSAGVEATHWPRYGAGIHRIEYPQRAESDWIEREVSDPHIAALIQADPFVGSGRLHLSAPRAGQIDTLMGG